MTPRNRLGHFLADAFLGLPLVLGRSWKWRFRRPRCIVKKSKAVQGAALHAFSMLLPSIYAVLYGTGLGFSTLVIHGGSGLCPRSAGVAPGGLAASSTSGPASDCALLHRILLRTGSNVALA
jgi:hypothetical protein